MPDFVDDMLTLPFPKQRLQRAPAGKENKYIGPEDWRRVCQALIDLRTHVIALAAGNGIDVTNDNAGALAIGTPVYSSGDGSVDKAKADDPAMATVVGIISDDSIASAATGKMKNSGTIVATQAQWNARTGGSGGLTQGVTYFASDITEGMIVAEADVTTTIGHVVARLGIALSPEELAVALAPPVEL